MSTLLALGEITVTDHPRVGGKAASLARLVARGLPVPDGSVLPTDRFVAWLRRRDLYDLAVAVHRGEAETDALQEAILAARLDPPWEEELRERVRQLGGVVAVRSSGLGEDGHRQSFAGQHESVLGVCEDEVAQAVLRCWASLYAPRALAYRQGKGPAPGSMAVLVQRQLAPRAAGVMFTVNPLTGSWREMTVEATWGLGEALVSGQVEPHWYLVRRPRRLPRAMRRVVARVRLAVVQTDAPRIDSELVVGAAGQVEERAVPASRREVPVLDERQLFALCRLGLRLEAITGLPQDVEWVLDEHARLWVVQTRPITTTGEVRPRADVLWTRRFIGERWPQAATPLGWSLVAPILEWFIAYPEVQRRYLGGGPPTRLENSRPYMNVTVFRHLLFKFPGTPPPQFMLEFLPAEEVERWRRRFAAKPDVEVYRAIFETTFREKRWRRFRWNPFKNHLHWEAFQEQLAQALPGVTRTPVSERDALTLIGQQRELVRSYVKVHITSLLFANLWFQWSEGFLSLWLPDDGPRLHEALAACPAGNRTLMANARLWQLAHLLDEAQLDALAAGELPDVPELRDFLAEYGHRAEASWEVFATRWRDQPSLLVPLLRAYRTAEDPAQLGQRQEQGFRVAMAELGRTPLSPGRRLVLERSIALTRAYLLLRENQRFWFDRILVALKDTSLWLGAHWVEAGVLDAADDIVFLTWDEVQGLADGSLERALARGWAAQRRVAFQEDLRQEPPDFLRGDEAMQELPQGQRLQALGVSPGRARGRVRVVRNLSEADRLQPGEILVTRATDPAWTPLFLVAGGAVLELGSRLSHGAVVAREYGLPCVVNVAGATRTLRDGQQVTVDGTRGLVFIHP